jgi:amidase
LLNAIAGSDPTDRATAEADARKVDFTAGLASASLAGVRIGVLSKQVGRDPNVERLFDQALADLARAGAVLVPIEHEPPAAMGEAEFAVLLYELREDLGAYLAASPARIPVRTLDEVIAFNQAHAAEELRWFGQDTFEQAAKATDRAAYEQARAESLRLAGPDGIDRLLAGNRVAFLIAPTTGPAWLTDLVLGDHYEGSIGAGSLAAIASYPHLSVPMGAVEGLPVGLSIIGAQWDDAAVLRAGAAYERARSAPLAVPNFGN